MSELCNGLAAIVLKRELEKIERLESAATERQRQLQSAILTASASAIGSPPKRRRARRGCGRKRSGRQARGRKGEQETERASRQPSSAPGRGERIRFEAEEASRKWSARDRKPMRVHGRERAARRPRPKAFRSRERRRRHAAADPVDRPQASAADPSGGLTSGARCRGRRRGWRMTGSGRRARRRCDRSEPEPRVFDRSAISRKPSQNGSSSEMLVRWPAMATERLTMPLLIRAHFVALVAARAAFRESSCLGLAERFFRFAAAEARRFASARRPFRRALLGLRACRRLTISAMGLAMSSSRREHRLGPDDGVELLRRDVAARAAPPPCNVVPFLCAALAIAAAWS